MICRTSAPPTKTTSPLTRMVPSLPTRLVIQGHLFDEKAAEPGPA
jgi:hypothetical protein